MPERVRGRTRSGKTVGFAVWHCRRLSSGLLVPVLLRPSTRTTSYATKSMCLAQLPYRASLRRAETRIDRLGTALSLYSTCGPLCRHLLYLLRRTAPRQALLNFHFLPHINLQEASTPPRSRPSYIDRLGCTKTRETSRSYILMLPWAQPHKNIGTHNAECEKKTQN